MEHRRLKNQLTAGKRKTAAHKIRDEEKKGAFPKAERIQRKALHGAFLRMRSGWILGDISTVLFNQLCSCTVKFGVTEESYLFGFSGYRKADKPRDRDTAGVGTELTEKKFPDGCEGAGLRFLKSFLQIAMRQVIRMIRVPHFVEKLLTQPEMKREFIIARHSSDKTNFFRIGKRTGKLGRFRTLAAA